MLKRLRLRFILLNMVLAALVMFAAFSSVCYLDYQSRVRDVYEALSFTLKQAQSPSIEQIEKLLPLQDLRDGSPRGGRTDEAASASAASAMSESDAADAASPEIGEDSAIDSQSDANTAATTPGIEIGRGDESPIPVAVYLVKSDGVYTALGNYASASISHSLLLTANAEALSWPTNSGLLEDVGLYFERRNTSNGMLIAYADQSNVNSWHQLAWNLLGVGLGVLVAFLVINIFFSWWALRPVERAWEQQSQFIADASHELKTPLAVILANIAILQSQPNATVKEQAQWVESTQTEAERMRSLVNDMLDLARPEDVARAEMVRLPVDLSDLAETEVLQFESVAFENGVEIESEIESGVTVLGSSERLQRMIGTLVDNACKYAGAGGNVSVELTKSRTSAYLNVSNNGAPISPEDLPHIFDRFYRADKARTSGTGGYGLGLAIAREIANEHNGDITASSSEAEGTSFKVKLPLMV